MYNRIKELRNVLNLNQKEFGKAIGLRSSISEIESNKAPITERTIIAICSKFNVSESWLKNGTGEMFNINDKKFEEFFEIYSKLSIPLQDFLLTIANELIKTQNKL